MLARVNPVDRILDDVFGVPFERRYIANHNYVLPVDIIENEGGYTVRVNAAGARAEDVRINVSEGNILEVTATFKENDRKYLLREIPSGEVARRFKLPQEVQADNEIEGRIVNGLIEFDLPYRAKGRVSIRISH